MVNFNRRTEFNNSVILLFDRSRAEKITIKNMHSGLHMSLFRYVWIFPVLLISVENTSLIKILFSIQLKESQEPI
jgi:hypothetical protein